MPKKVVLTPEQIESGVAKNAGEYNARVAALRALHDEKAYNPAIDPTTLQKLASEATRGSAASGPALPVYNSGGVVEGDIRLKGVDAAAEAQAKRNGGRKRNGKTEDEEGESGEGEAGDGGVQARQAPFGFQTRPSGQVPSAGGGNSTQSVWTEQTFEAESEEAVRAMVPAGAKAVEVFQVWKATALVKM
jgi:hypothetical protein